MDRTRNRNGVAFAFALAFILGGSGSGAQLMPLTGEFQANTYTTHAQFDVSVETAANGDFVVVWSSGEYFGPGTQDGSNLGVFGQRFGSAGNPLGSEFQVNIHTPDRQADAALAVESDGDFVAVWASGEIGGSGTQDGENLGIFGQRFSSSGAATGGEFQINTYTSGYQYGPAVAMTTSGDFIVVWSSAFLTFQDGDGSGIFGQRYDSSGVPLGSEFQVNTMTVSDQRTSDVTTDAAGGFVVVWSSYQQDGDKEGVFGQRFDSNGGALGSEFQVNSYTNYNQYVPTIARDGSGGFVVVWSTGEYPSAGTQDGSYAGVFGRHFDSNGTATGGEFQVNLVTADVQAFPAIAAQSNGDFVVAWMSYFQDGASYGTFARAFTSSGNAVGGEIQLNSYTTQYQVLPWIAAQPNGEYVVSWESFAQDGNDEAAILRRVGFLNLTCAAAPVMGCETRGAGKTKVLIKNSTDNTKDKLLWKFKGGTAASILADFGDPSIGTGYTLCLYDGTGLKGSAGISPGTLWSATGTTGFKYKDVGATNAGVTKVKLKSGAIGKTKIIVKGKGANLSDSIDTALTGTVTVQFRNVNSGKCWEDTYPAGGDTVQFKAKN